jgi:hypothetical protein
MDIRLEDVKNIIIIAYAIWKWKKEYDEKQKERSGVHRRKRKPQKRSK